MEPDNAGRCRAEAEAAVLRANNVALSKALEQVSGDRRWKADRCRNGQPHLVGLGDDPHFDVAAARRTDRIDNRFHTCFIRRRRARSRARIDHGLDGEMFGVAGGPQRLDGRLDQRLQRRRPDRQFHGARQHA